MYYPAGRSGVDDELLAFAEALGGAESVDVVLARSLSVIRSLLSDATVTYHGLDAGSDAVTTFESTDTTEAVHRSGDESVPVSVVRSAIEAESVTRGDAFVTETDAEGWDTATTGDTATTDLFAPVADHGVLRVTLPSADGAADRTTALIERVASAAAAALNRVGGSREPDRERRRDAAALDAAALHQFHETTMAGAEFDAAVAELLSLARDYVELDVGIFSRVEDETYTVESVADRTGTYETEATFDAAEAVCAATLGGNPTEPVAFADVTETEYAASSAAEGVDAYIGVPVFVDGASYGTVAFFSEEPRSAPFRAGEREFVKLLAQWVGTEIERRHRFEELERYETILQAVDDPVYALDAAGEFTFVNEAAKREFGYGDEVIGADPSIGMDEADIARVREQIVDLIAEDEWSKQAEFDLHTADGSRKIVENRIALIGDDEFRGSAGVLRDITSRKRRERQLTSIKRAIEQSADGFAILDDGEYTYVDETHVEMYGFESKAQLLGDSWRRLYDDDEIDRLEAEAFPALEAEGRWRGAVTGRRPDGTTFPAELSLTIIEDGRLVCTVRDETDRKERERELELKERAMDEATVAIQIADATRDDNPLVYVNDGFEQVTGYASEETLGRNPRFLQGDDTDPEQRARLRKAIERDEPVSLDIQNYRKDGTQYWSRLSITPVTDDQGTVRNYIGIQQDVTDRREREQKLFAERERFRLLLESVDEYAFLAVDEEGRIQTWNENAESLFGYDEEAAVGMSTAELHRTDDREVGVSDRLLDQARSAGQSAHEGWYVRADENRFYADVRYARLEHDDGTFRGYAMIVRDMTERRRQQRRTERFVEESDDVITVVDTAGTITYASGSSRNVFAHEPDDLVGGNLFDHAHPTDRKETMEAFFEAVERSDSNRELEFRLESGDGEWLNVEGQCRNMLDDGAVDGMLLYLRDVTDRRERARRFESVFNQTFQFAGLLNPDGTVVEVNDTEFAFGEETRETLVGERFCDTALWEHSDAARTDLRTAVERAAEGEGTRYETTMYGANGLVTVDLSVKPVTREDGDTSLIVVAGRDVSAEQRQRQHLDVVHRVLRHNMRNDLGKVRGWAELMCEESDRDARSEHLATLNRILDKWESMTERVKQIRRASQRIDQSTGADPDSLVADATDPVRDEYPDATISTEVSADALTRVPATLLDAIRELAENAANTGPDADVEVELSSPEDGWIEVSVRDDGPGLPQMEADALETGEETPLNHGNGLGLWMVRMITTQAGGDISVRTAEAGTDVRLRVPTE
ncbi:hypothetical protein B9H04_14035 [Halorubrum ezzemoulense DSM 17463]|uniref:Histidine kinase n=1 Tax=Halorubrum ezzemoulense DSM 17463 TaxID=1121945 RepID=A0A1X4GBI9_HALEZ|nr:hypothetical protein B9H04_14035 [Halorubrum ezzemoulense DSM 17463]